MNVLVPVPERVRLLNIDEVEVMVCALPPKITFPVPGLKTEPTPLHAFRLVELTFKVLEFPFKVPALNAISPEKVWFIKGPRSRVPPEPFTDSAAPFKIPAIVAVPAVFDMVTVPVVVNVPIVWSAVPAKVTPPDPDVVAPLLTRLPFKVSNQAAISRVAPLLSVKGADALKTLAELAVTTPVDVITTPPLAINGVTHSFVEAVLVVALY